MMLLMCVSGWMVVDNQSLWEWY